MYVRYTPNGKNENGRMTASGLPIRRTALSSRKIGSTSAVFGISMTMSVVTSSSRRPLNCDQRERVAGGDADDQRQGERRERVVHRVAEPDREDPAAEGEQLVPVRDELVERAEGERAVEQELVVGLGRASSSQMIGTMKKATNPTIRTTTKTRDSHCAG